MSYNHHIQTEMSKESTVNLIFLNFFILEFFLHVLLYACLWLIYCVFLCACTIHTNCPIPLKKSHLPMLPKTETFPKTITVKQWCPNIDPQIWNSKYAGPWNHFSHVLHACWLFDILCILMYICTCVHMWLTIY